jgi:dTDP-4-amino-4,6-dideoxygalactose transaminase
MPNPEFPQWPHFTEEEADEVRRVLLSNKVNYWTGEECKRFEQEFARWVGVEYAIALANGTVALEAALRGINLAPGDEVIVTPRTFIASASSIVQAGAVPVFADVDPVSQNITAQTIEAALSPRTRAIVCVHLAGWPCDMDPIMQLARERNLYVIEDCAQAHGARYKGRSVGSIGHVAAWSFCQDKIMTTGGEGGMVTTNDRELWSRMWSYKEHGKSWQAVHEGSRPVGFRWLHHSFGTNGRMTEMQAAIGRLQLKKVSSWVRQRRENARILNERLSDVRWLRATHPPREVEHAYYKYYVFIKPEEMPSAWDRDRIMAEMQNAGIPCFSGVCPEVYLEHAFKGSPFAHRRLPVARELGGTSLMFLVHPTLEARHMEATADKLIQLLRSAAG